MRRAAIQAVSGGTGRKRLALAAIIIGCAACGGSVPQVIVDAIVPCTDGDWRCNHNVVETCSTYSHLNDPAYTYWEQTEDCSKSSRTCTDSPQYCVAEQGYSQVCCK